MKGLLRATFTIVLMAALMVDAAARESVDGVDRKEEVSRAIRTYLSRLEGFGYSGAVLVAKDDKVLVENAYGLADKRKKIPVRTDTIFDIGSLTKQFTAAAILVLESDGKLHLTDPLSKYLKAVPSDKAVITIHQLLTHTSGLAMDFGDDYEKVSRDEIVSRAMASKLQSPPGERHAYSNAGYSLLAAIVEIVSGQTFESFLHERLFLPAGMKSTGYTFSGQTLNRLARGYKDGEDWGTGAEKAAGAGGEVWNLIGNGGVHSTVGDLYKWISALEQGKVLTKDARQKFFQPHVIANANYRNSNIPLFYAYGWYVLKQPSGNTLIWHLGGNGVFNAAVRYHIDESALVVYTSNVSEFHDPIYPVPAIERMLAGKTVQMPPVVMSLTPQQLAEYAGRYRADSGAIMSVETKGPFLKVEGEGQEALSFITTGRWQKDSALEAMNERTVKVVKNSRTRKYEDLLQEYGEEVTLEGLKELETLFWKKRHDRHGDYIRTRILGTIPLRGRAFVGRTIVAIDFERGTTYREYLWTPTGKIGDVGPIVSAPSSRYFPESASCFVKFEPAEAILSSRICFKKDDRHSSVATLVQNEELVKLKKF